MNIILLKNKVILSSFNFVDENKKEIHIDRNYLVNDHNYNYYVDMNGSGYNLISDFKFQIPDNIDTLKVLIKVVNKSTGNEEIYASEEWPITRYMLLNEFDESKYPKFIMELKFKIKELETRIAKIEEEEDFL